MTLERVPGLGYGERMSRLLGALGIGAVAALATAIVALLVAVLLVGSDRAVVGALAVALGGGAVVTPLAWWLLGRRAVPPPSATGSGAVTRRSTR